MKHEEHLIRIEAQNLDSFVYDNDDLSTVRGAGLILLNLHSILCGEFSVSGQPSSAILKRVADDDRFTLKIGEECVELTVVSKGASTVVYSFNYGGSEIALIRQHLQQFLRRHPMLRHATCAVAVSDTSRGFREAWESLVTGTRLQQMRYATFRPGVVNTNDQMTGFCQIDHKRAGTEKLTAAAADKNRVSQSTHIRREVGQHWKKQVYSDLAGSAADDLNPTSDLAALSIRGDHVDQEEEFLWQGKSDPLAAMDGKMAVLYLDGNRFSRLLQTNCKSVDDFVQADQNLLAFRRELMTAFVECVKSTAAFRRWDPKDRSIEHRIETLMWGGDELVWVVPAWMALPVAEWFFEATAKWKLFDTKLTHAMGLVICSHKAPIRSVVQLAHRLADGVKQVVGDKPHEPVANAVAYQVLDSFDFVGEDVTAIRQRLKIARFPDEQLVLSAEDLTAVIRCIEDLKWKKWQIPNRRIYQVVQSLKQTKDGEATSDSTGYTQVLGRIAEVAVAAGSREDFLKKMKSPLKDTRIKDPAAAWQHLATLWEFCSEMAGSLHCGARQAEQGQAV